MYGSQDLCVKHCSFDGPADGESALKESSRIEVENCFWNLRYPFWHDHGLKNPGGQSLRNCAGPLCGIRIISRSRIPNSTESKRSENARM